MTTLAKHTLAFFASDRWAQVVLVFALVVLAVCIFRAVPMAKNDLKTVRLEVER